MRYAVYPGCVSRGACPELYVATLEVCRRLGIELDLVAMQGASCTGAGVLQEKNLRLADTLNARTFAMAERAKLPILTICSTCQGVMSQANERLQDEGYRASINEELAEEGLAYSGGADPVHLLWVIVEEVGSTTLIPPRSILEVRDDGSLVVSVPRATEGVGWTSTAGVGLPPERDPVTLTVVNNALSNICEEMSSAMIRTAYSPIFRE